MAETILTRSTVPASYRYDGVIGKVRWPAGASRCVPNVLYAVLERSSKVRPGTTVSITKSHCTGTTTFPCGIPETAKVVAVRDWVSITDTDIPPLLFTTT